MTSYRVWDSADVLSEDSNKTVMIITMLYNALNDAIEGMEEMLPYVDEYFARKHDLLAYVERAQTSLDVAKESIIN